MTDDELQKIVDESYDRFIKDESIIGFESLLKSIGGGSRLRNKIRKLIYEKYGKNTLIKIYRSRLAKSAHKNRTSESYTISPERREKMIDGIKKSWENADVRREQARNLMIKHCHPIAWTDDTNKKRRDSRIGYKHSAETIKKISDSLCGKSLSDEHKMALCVPKIRPGSLGLKRSQETKNKLSSITKNQWKSGLHKPIYKSKGHQEIIDILKQFGLEIVDEYIVDGRPYDVYIKNINCIIEFNGTYWHRDPRFYNDTLACKKIWERDHNKVDVAMKRGYTVVTIWQHDWESCKDKRLLIKDILNANTFR